jgi:hypothetical protein
LEDSGPLFEEEEHLVVNLKESLDLVVEVLMVPDDESFSLNELARLVYDPFPARLTVAVHGLVLETDGWQITDGIYERPAVDAWNALRSLEGRWIEPDLVTALAAPASEDGQPDPDPVDFAARPRYFSMPPTSGEVESAVLNHLIPEEVLRLRWRTPPDREDNQPFDSVFWLPAMAEAERVILD